MAEKRIYLLAQLDAAANQTMAALYGRLAQAGLVGTQTKGIPYHFTLGSFEAGQAAQAVALAQDTARKTSAFDVRLSHVGLFGLQVLFLAPSRTTELLRLVNGLAPDAQRSGQHAWVAHATLLMDSPDNIQAAIPIVARAFAPFTARVESIGVYAFFPKAYLAEYRLGG